MDSATDLFFILLTGIAGFALMWFGWAALTRAAHRLVPALPIDTVQGWIAGVAIAGVYALFPTFFAYLAYPSAIFALGVFCAATAAIWHLWMRRV